MNFIVKPLLLIGIALLVNNCASKPTHLELIVKSNKDLNPNNSNVPSPMVLMMYELQDDAAFMKFDFWSLTDDAKKTLDGTLISQSKHLLVPDENQTYKILFDKNAKYIGLVGGFRNIDKGSQWRYIKALKNDQYNRIELNISNNTIKEVK
jgi:type VI secretion system protein VasD